MSTPEGQCFESVGISGLSAHIYCDTDVGATTGILITACCDGVVIKQAKIKARLLPGCGAGRVVTKLLGAFLAFRGGHRFAVGDNAVGGASFLNAR